MISARRLGCIVDLKWIETTKLSCVSARIKYIQTVPTGFMHISWFFIILVRIIACCCYASFFLLYVSGGEWQEQNKWKDNKTKRLKNYDNQPQKNNNNLNNIMGRSCNRKQHQNFPQQSVGQILRFWKKKQQQNGKGITGQIKYLLWFKPLCWPSPFVVSVLDFA